MLHLDVGVQIIDLAGEIFLRLVDAGQIESERTSARAVQAGDHVVEILRESRRGVLEEILHSGKVILQRGLQCTRIDAQRAVVVQVEAQAGEIYDAVVSGDGEGNGGQELRLGVAHAAIGGERTASGAIRIHVELHVDVVNRLMVSYADFITLLFAFFVVLYASSQVDKRKIGKLALSIQVAFQDLGVFETSNTKIPLSDSEALPFSQVQVVENAERTGDLSHFVQPMKGILSPNPASAPMKAIQAELEKALAPEISKHVVEVQARREGIVVSLREIGFYESGSANLRPASKEAIDRLAAVLKSHNEMLRIEGHTDNIPIHNTRFDSNWELSTARAADLIKLFITQYYFNPARLSAAGYAEYHPVAPNDTPDNRARNRRVDIVILNAQAPEPAPSESRGASPPASRSLSPKVPGPSAGPH